MTAATTAEVEVAQKAAEAAQATATEALTLAEDPVGQTKVQNEEARKTAEAAGAAQREKADKDLKTPIGS